MAINRVIIHTDGLSDETVREILRFASSIQSNTSSASDQVIFISVRRDRRLEVALIADNEAAIQAYEEQLRQDDDEDSGIIWKVFNFLVRFVSHLILEGCSVTPILSELVNEDLELLLLLVENLLSLAGLDVDLQDDFIHRLEQAKEEIERLISNMLE